MNRLSFTTEYIKNYSLKYNFGENHIAPHTYAMYWCMVATHTNRLFTRNDMYEFLVRLAITFDILKIVDNWFAYDKLVPFKINETSYNLKVEDVYAHMGFEASDSYKNKLTRKKFLQDITKNINAAIVIGTLGYNFQVIQPQKIEEDTFLINGKQYTPSITSDLVKKAKFFADDILKMSPKKLFEEMPVARKEKMDELEERRKAIKNLPKFSLQMLSEEIIEQCMQLMLGKEELEVLKQEPEDYEEESYRLIHLAWMFANDLAWGDEYNWNIHEGAEIDLDDYPLDDGGINLYGTYEEYNMEGCEELLKGVGF